MKRLVSVAALLLAPLTSGADEFTLQNAAIALPFPEEVLFESGSLGQTGVVPSPENPAANINQFAFNGARFRLTEPVLTTRVGGHFVGSGDLFGAIVQLANSDDFPDSEDLSTPDVLGATQLTFTNPSNEIFGDLSLTLLPGDYALIFGSGLFGADGGGGAPLNNADIGAPSNIGFLSGFGWGDRPGGFRFFVSGVIIPEASSIASLTLAVCVGVACRRQRSL